MTTYRRPPVIPEITKAYQNDPRTQLALKSIGAGSSTAPVAGGKYAYADGIARVLQGLGGAYVNKKTEQRYGADEAKLLAQRQQRGVDGLSSAPGAAQAPAIAAALGAPAPPPVASAGPPMLRGGGSTPMARAVMDMGVPQTAAPSALKTAVMDMGVPQTAAPQTAAPSALKTAVMDMGPSASTAPLPPQNGGGPMGRGPFGLRAGSGGNSPAFLAPPTQEIVPDGPAAVAKPVRPDAIGPTKSRMLNAAYRVMSDANPYESAQGQDMYTEGLGEQTKLDESAAERQQHLIDSEYGTDRELYANAASQDRASVIRGREDVIARNADAIKDFKDKTFQYGVHKEDQQFTAGEKAKDRASEWGIARMKISADAERAADLTSQEQQALTQAAQEGRVDITRMTRYNRKIMAQTFLANPKFDAMTNHAQAALAANAPAQQKAMMASALPTVLANVRDAGKKINLSDLKFAANIQAWEKGQTTDPAFVEYMNNRVDATMMIGQVMGGTGVTDQRVKQELAAAPHMSPRGWDAWYNSQMKSLAPRIKIMEQRKLLPAGTYNSMATDVSVPAKPSVSNW